MEDRLNLSTKITVVVPKEAHWAGWCHVSIIYVVRDSRSEKYANTNQNQEHEPPLVWMQSVPRLVVQCLAIVRCKCVKKMYRMMRKSV